MPETLNELLRLFFQPPVLILFALAVAGLFDLLQRRSDYRDRINLEWRARESFYKGMGLSDGLIEGMRERFYQRVFRRKPKRR